MDVRFSRRREGESTSTLGGSTSTRNGKSTRQKVPLLEKIQFRVEPRINKLRCENVVEKGGRQLNGQSPRFHRRRVGNTLVAENQDNRVAGLY